MAFSFRNFFFGQLPLYYKINDTYKDIDDRGLLERYLEIFGMEIDDNLIPKIDNYLDIITPYDTDPKFLTSLGYTLGSPPDLFNDPNSYAKILAYIIQIYKIKGTKKALILLFALLGFNITVNELSPDKGVTLDNNDTLDDDNQLDSGCPGCSDYEIIIAPVLNPGNGTCPPTLFSSVDNTILATFIKIIEFNQPINAKLKALINGGLICEEVNLCIDNIIAFNLKVANTLDAGLTLDNGIVLDDPSTVTSQTINFDCEDNNILDGIDFMIIEDTFIIR